MKNIIIFLITLLSLNLIQIRAQKFDMKDFNKKLEKSEWLLNYDLVAWFSTDILRTKDPEKLSKLGREWFCFQDSDNVWHSVYGKFEDDKYNQVFHFIVKSQTEVTETDEQIDAKFLNKYGKALSRAFLEMKPINDSTAVHFNHYVKENDKGNLDVYIFPAFQPDGTAVYGGEFVYEISPKNKIIKDRSYFKGKFYGFKTEAPTEIWLDYKTLEKPTIGSVFFAWYYKDFFTKITIDNKTSFTTLLNGSEGWHWSTVIKDLKPENKRKKDE